MSASDDSTRPLSVAELLARNGTIGSPPVSGRRRRRRRNSDGLSVAELTGEIPVVVTEEEAPEEGATEDDFIEEDFVEGESTAEGSVATYDEAVYQEAVEEGAVSEVVVYDEAVYDEVVVDEAVVDEALVDEVVDEAVADHHVDAEQPVVESSETVVVYSSAEIPEYESEYTAEETSEYVDQELDEDLDEDLGRDADQDLDQGVAEIVNEAAVVEPLPLATDPLPRRSDSPQRGHDPRPVRRSSGAEQMAYDPVDESVNLDELVEEHVEDVEQLRSYLSTSQDTLFSGGTVADDLARRATDFDEYQKDQAGATTSGPARPRQVGTTLWNGVLAVVQSLVAVVFGAALFIGFDQLWRWNNLVALILSVLVVLTLAAAVRFVRKTEDIVSTLTAVAVGLLVTLGPLALQST